MIQRIQTVYLSLAAISSIVYAFLPISTVIVNDSMYTVKPIGVFYHDGDTMMFDSPLITVGSVLFFHILLTVITIFQFKKRPFQLRLVSLNLVLIIICMVMSFFYGDQHPEKPEGMTETTIEFGIGGFALIASFAFTFLARMGIMKDEKLVKSLDRLR